MKQGTFYLDWREDGKRIQKAVGTNGHEAIEAHRVQTKIHELRVSGVAVEQDAPQLAPGRESMRQRIDHFLEDRRVTLRPKSLKKYSEALTSFLAFTKKRYIEDIKPDDIRGFLAHMTLAEKLAPKTAKVKGRIVHGVLTGLGAALRMERGDWPKVTKKQRLPCTKRSRCRRCFLQLAANITSCGVSSSIPGFGSRRLRSVRGAMLISNAARYQSQRNPISVLRSRIISSARFQSQRNYSIYFVSTMPRFHRT